MTNNQSLSGRHALVTGGGRGVGKGIALALARVGASVAINYASSKTDADKTVDEVRGLGVDAFAVQADVSVMWRTRVLSGSPKCA